MPFNRAEPHPLLVEWAENRQLAGGGRPAVVVGCGLGADAEYIAGRGFNTVGFDISETAVRLARQRHPGTSVRYVAADLLDPPREWLRSFDIVVEIITVQALPEPPRRQAIANIARLVATDGTLLVIAAIHDDNKPADANQTLAAPQRRDQGVRHGRTQPRPHRDRSQARVTHRAALASRTPPSSIGTDGRPVSNGQLLAAQFGAERVGTESEVSRSRASGSRHRGRGQLWPGPRRCRRVRLLLQD
jgi:SAM-dependent methyltransferase